MSAKLNLVLLIIFGLFLAALIGRNSAFAWMSLPFLFYVGAGLLVAPRSHQLHAVRSTNVLRCGAGTSIAMRVVIENQGKTIPAVRIDDRCYPDLKIIDGYASRALCLPVGEKTDLNYTFQALRGHYRWEKVSVTVSDPFGLFITTAQIPAYAEVIVYPAELSVHGLRLRPRQTLHITGPNLSRLGGAGIDFFGVREYHSGDSLRFIHWRLSARHPRQFFSKEFEREEMADVCLILDCNAAANLQFGSQELFEYSVQAAAAVARKVLRMGNRLSMLILGQRLVRVFPATGKRQLYSILDQLAACQKSANASLSSLKYLPVRLFPNRALIMIISPLRAADVSTLAALRAKGYQVLLVSPDPVDFSAQNAAHHPLALRMARLERNSLLWRMREIGVQVIDWSVSEPLNVVDSFQWVRR